MTDERNPFEGIIKLAVALVTAALLLGIVAAGIVAAVVLR